MIIAPIIYIISAIVYALGIITKGHFAVWTIIGTSALVIDFICYIIYTKTGFLRFYYHDILGWHKPDKKPLYYDGCSVHATCKFCGKEIMQDSQGNWF